MLHILAVLDGRRGHEKQTYGIISALQRRVKVEVTTLVVSHTPQAKIKVFFQFLFPWLVPVQKAHRNADLILCTGGKTHFTGMFLKRKYGHPLCVSMTPGYGFRRFFDLCFVPEHDRVTSSPNIVQTFGAPTPCTDKGRHEEGRGLILLGGVDEKSHHWHEEKLLSQLEEIFMRGNKTDFWIVSSSPRTPQSTGEKIKKMSEKRQNVTFFDYRDTPNGWVEEQYDKASLVWVTGDSISMVYEALSAGCKVHVLPLEWVDKGGKFALNERLLRERGVTLSWSDWQVGRKLQSTVELNEAQRCADIILEKWWPKNLP